MKRVVGIVSLVLVALFVFGGSTPAGATTLCPGAANINNPAFVTAVPGALDSMCGADSARKLTIASDLDYVRLKWTPGPVGYPYNYEVGFTVGDLIPWGLSARVSGLSGDIQPYYMLEFNAPDVNLGQVAAGNQILMLEFQPVNVTGNQMILDPNVTKFNLYDNDAGRYLAGGQQDAHSLAYWLGLYPALANEQLTGIRIGIGLGGGPGTGASATIESLQVAPEPGTFSLIGLVGAGALAALRRRRKGA